YTGSRGARRPGVPRPLDLFERTEWKERRGRARRRPNNPGDDACLFHPPPLAGEDASEAKRVVPEPRGVKLRNIPVCVATERERESAMGAGPPPRPSPASGASGGGRRFTSLAQWGDGAVPGAVPIVPVRHSYTNRSNPRLPRLAQPRSTARSPHAS